MAEGLPVPVIIAVDSILPPENMETQLPQAKQALVNTEANTIFEGLMSYLQARVPASQGNQKTGQRRQQLRHCNNVARPLILTG